MVHEIIPVMIGEEETNARLYTYFWSNSKELYDGRRRPCVLICPGRICDDFGPGGGRFSAVRFMEMGYHAAILRYSTVPEQYFQTCFYRRRPV